MSELMDVILETRLSGPLPLWVAMLKAERVADAAPQSRSQMAEAERVQTRLEAMPGWGVVPGGMALGRVRELGSAANAADYAAFVVQAAGRERFPVDVFVAGNHVVFALRGRARGTQNTINDNLLDFAASLG
jgi:hypothetical protein